MPATRPSTPGADGDLPVRTATTFAVRSRRPSPGVTADARVSRSRLAAGAVGLALALSASAGSAAAPGGRLIATGGASSIDGAAGGGLVPWATLAGYAERGEVGGAVAATGVALPDFDMRSGGAAVTFSNRLEISIAKQRFDAGSVVPGTTLEQDILGVKTRLAGDLVYGDLPQISVGALFKRNVEFDVPRAVGARDDAGVDAYLSAARLWLDGPFGRSVFVNGTLRATRANQLGPARLRRRPGRTATASWARAARGCS